MADGKKSFILYADQRGIFDKLSDEQAGKLVKHIYSYVNDENPNGDFVTDLAFESIKQQLKRDLDKWSRQRWQRIEAGKKSAESRKNARNSNENERPLKVVHENERNPTVNDNVNVNVNDNVNVNAIKKKIFSFKKSLIDYGFEKDLIDDWLVVRKNKKASNTETAFNGFISEVKKSGLEKNKILQECITRSWAGFKSEWLEKEKSSAKKENENGQTKFPHLQELLYGQ